MSAARPRPRPRPQPAAVADPAPPPVPAGAGEATPERPAPEPAELGRHRSRRPRRVRRRRDGIVAVLALLLAIAAGVTVVALRHGGNGTDDAAPASSGSVDRATLLDPSGATAFLAGATSDIAAVTSYDYRSLSDARFAGDAVTTGSYRTAYRAALAGSLGAAARRYHRVQTFQLLAAASGAVSDDGRLANVLMFGTQTVTDDTSRRPRSSVITLTAAVVHRGPRYLISRLVADADPGLPPGSPGLGDAADAAREEVGDLLSFRRDRFVADANRAVAGSAEPLTGQIRAQAAGTRRALVKGGYDLQGAVTALGVVRAAGRTLTLLVAATDTRIPDRGARVSTYGRYEVEVIRSAGTWLVSSVDPVTG